MRSVFRKQAIWPAMILCVIVGCEIQKSEVIPPAPVGSVYVTLSTATAESLDSARISIDAIETSQVTPDTVVGLSAGVHAVGAFKPGYEYVSAQVTVVADSTVLAALVTTATTEPPPVIELIDAPDSTVLLLNNVPFGTVPPNRFPNVGVGSFRISMYFPEHATNLPAQWTYTLELGDTIRIPAGFTFVLPGSQPEQLAPLFALADDLDSSIFRLQDYRGQVLLLSFFFADCAPCLSEMPYIQTVYADESYAGRIQFFGIDPIDSYSVFSSFRYSSAPYLTFPLLHGAGQGVREAYNVVPFPTNIIIDQTGKIRYRYAGVNENLLRQAIDALLAETP